MKADYVNNTYCDGEWWEEEHYDEETGEYWYEQVYYEDCWTEEYTTFDYEYAGRPVSDDCNYNQHCEIVFYGHGGLVFNGKFTMSANYRTHFYWEYSDDGNHTYYNKYYYENYTATFDLPFEPYGFSIIQNGMIYRIF